MKKVEHKRVAPVFVFEEVKLGGDNEKRDGKQFDLVSANTNPNKLPSDQPE
jgi:hypothetical protein